MERHGILATVLLIAAGVAPAAAHHRQTPAVVQLSTSTADNALPRVAPSGPAVVWAEGPTGNRSVYEIKLAKFAVKIPLSTTPGDNRLPTTTQTGKYTVWENDPGSSVTGAFVNSKGVVSSLVAFPAGNPAVTGLGTRVYFEANEDLDIYNPNPTHARQVFHRFKDGSVKQISRGDGTSGNPVAPKTNGFVAFDSTSDPVDGHDTGIPQIWTANAQPFVATTTRITAGAAASELPQTCSDGAVVVFQSRADLATDGHDMGVSQVFAYVVANHTFAQVTDDAGGCELPSVYRLGANYRIAFTCSGQPFYYELKTDQRFRLPMPLGAHTSRVISGLGTWFLLLSTTGNLSGTGLTTEHQLYIVNLYKRPAVPAPGNLATWFPYRGL